jgi:MFS family permease
MTGKSYSLTAYQVRLLVVLALINFVNFAARQVFVPLIPLLRVHLNVTDAQLGSLQTWLLLVLAVSSVPFGYFADRVSRKAIIWIGILCWSLATFAGGLASTFVSFLVARAFVGLGEAAYAPAAQSMISGAFPKERRAMAQSIFAAGMLLGGACGQVLGGIVGSRYGWQAAFFIVAIAGLIPSLALFSIEEPSRGPRCEVVPIASLFKIPAFMAMIAAGACVTFASVSLLTWGVDFVESYKDFSLREASVALSLAALFSAITGVLAGGAAADFYRGVLHMVGSLPWPPLSCSPPRFCCWLSRRKRNRSYYWAWWFPVFLWPGI